MKILSLLVVCGFWVSVADAQVKSHFRLPPALNEVSGLVINNEGKFIWHNDSDHDPILYFTDGEGKLLGVVSLQRLMKR